MQFNQIQQIRFDNTSASKAAKSLTYKCITLYKQILKMLYVKIDENIAKLVLTRKPITSGPFEIYCSRCDNTILKTISMLRGNFELIFFRWFELGRFIKDIS